MGCLSYSANDSDKEYCLQLIKTTLGYSVVEHTQIKVSDLDEALKTYHITLSKKLG